MGDSDTERNLFFCVLTLPVCSRCCVLLKVTATRTSPPLYAADNERINMYIPCRVNARPQRFNFTAQFEGGGSSGTSEATVSASRRGKNNRSELLSGYMTDGPADGTQGGGNEKRFESERETEEKKD